MNLITVASVSGSVLAALFALFSDRLRLHRRETPADAPTGTVNVELRQQDGTLLAAGEVSAENARFMSNIVRDDPHNPTV